MFTTLNSRIQTTSGNFLIFWSRPFPIGIKRFRHILESAYFLICFADVDKTARCVIQEIENSCWIFKGELRPEISLLHMKVLTLIKAKSNVFLWYVQCCSCTRRSKTRAPPYWIKFDVVTSHRQTRHLEYRLWLLISMFLRLLISCKSQENRLRVSSNRFK